MIEGDPFSLIEAMTIAGYATGCEHGYVYLRGEYPQAHAHPRRRDRRGAPPRLPRRRRAGRGLRVRHRDPQGRRRLHLRRGDGDLQLDRGLPRRAAHQAAVPGGRRPVRQADRRQQRRDAGQRARRRAATAAPGSPAIGTEGSTGTKLFCLSGNVDAPGRLRGAVRHDAAASCSTWPAAWPAGASCRPCCWAARPAASCGPTSSTCRSRSRARARRRRRSARASCW